MMPWWTLIWIFGLIGYAVATVWNDRYEQRTGLITWTAISNIVLNFLFIFMWVYPTRLNALVPLLPALAAISLILVLWHGTSGYRQIKKESPQNYLPGEHKTLVQIHALILPVEIAIFAPSILLALLTWHSFNS